MRCCCGRLVLSSSRISPLGILKITLIRRWISMKNSLTSTILENNPNTVKIEFSFEKNSPVLLIVYRICWTSHHRNSLDQMVLIQNWYRITWREPPITFRIIFWQHKSQQGEKFLLKTALSRLNLGIQKSRKSHLYRTGEGLYKVKPTFERGTFFSENFGCTL